MDPTLSDKDFFAYELNDPAYRLFVELQTELAEQYMRTEDFPMKVAWGKIVKEFKRRAILTKDPAECRKLGIHK